MKLPVRVTHELTPALEERLDRTSAELRALRVTLFLVGILVVVAIGALRATMRSEAAR